MATNSTRWRAVFDTNCIIAALKSPNPTSPNVELVRRWSDGEFDLLYTEQIRAEYVEKFVARSIAKQISDNFLASLERRGILVPVLDSEIIRVIDDDPDDDVLLACAVKGRATHLITYDPHFNFLDGNYQRIRIVRPLQFLYLVRGDTPPV